MPGCCCSPFECAANQQFNQKKVAHELRRYRQQGPGPTTRLFVDGIVHSAPTTGTVLDIGSGVGGLTLALLEHGASSAIAVDASARTSMRRALKPRSADVPTRFGLSTPISLRRPPNFPPRVS
jgi:predicted RNA methylase